MRLFNGNVSRNNHSGYEPEAMRTAAYFGYIQLFGSVRKREEDMSIYGYARVSSKDQNLNRQFDALALFPVESSNVFVDYESGKDFNRPGYKKLLQVLQPGDLLAIKSIDRLGRNYEEILQQWRLITREHGTDISVIDMPLLNTGQNGIDGITGTLISDIVLQVLSYVAQVERENIHQRQAEGIAAAKARGVKFGRPPIAQPRNFSEALTLWQEGEIGAREAARRLSVSHTTFLKWAHAPAASS